MNKKVLIISSSPRKDGNSETLAAAFAEGAREAGHQVETVYLREKQVGFCKGCFACLKLGHCVIQDDAVEIAAKMETDQKLAFQYAALCNAKLQFLIKRIEQLTTQTCCGKIAAYLLAHRSADGQVKSPCSRDGLARQLGVSRAALFRALSSLQAAGVIAAQSEGFVITDSDGLEQILYSSAK